MKHRLLLTSLGVSAALVTSCSVGGRSPSGFLSNYDQLNAGYGTRDAVSAYLNPEANLGQYDSVIIEPVTTIFATSGVSPVVSSQLAAYLSASLQQEIGPVLRVVATPGPRTLRFRCALTDVIEGREAANPTTTVHTAPTATLSGPLGSHELAAFISHVSFEGEILDSTSGKRLGAMCDHRLGAKRQASPSSTWDGVRSATRQGVVRMKDRFLSARSN
jgi:hypothetical protein